MNILVEVLQINLIDVFVVCIFIPLPNET